MRNNIKTDQEAVAKYRQQPLKERRNQRIWITSVTSVCFPIRNRIGRVVVKKNM